MERPIVGVLVHELCHKAKLCRYVYSKIIHKRPFEIKSLPKWETSLGRIFEGSDWHKIFTLPKHTTLDSQIRIFQYKIIHRILSTNSLLHKYQLRDNPFYDHCKNVTETVEHTFHLCPLKLKLWYDLAEWLSPDIDLYPFINSENILLGIHEENSPLENIIIVAIKRYIYINKCKSIPISLMGAIGFLKHIMIIETNLTTVYRRDINVNKWRLINDRLFHFNVL